MNYQFYKKLFIEIQEEQYQGNIKIDRFYSNFRVFIFMISFPLYDVTDTIMAIASSIPCIKIFSYLKFNISRQRI